MLPGLCRDIGVRVPISDCAFLFRILFLLLPAAAAFCVRFSTLSVAAVLAGGLFWLLFQLLNLGRLRERDLFMYSLEGEELFCCCFRAWSSFVFRLRASEFGTNEEDASPPDRRPLPSPCADELRTTITGIDFERSRKSRPPWPPYTNEDFLEESYQDQEQGVPRHHFEWCYARGRAQSNARGDLLFTELLLSQIIKTASVLARGRAQSNSTTPKSSSAWCMECPAKKRC